MTAIQSYSRLIDSIFGAGTTSGRPTLNLLFTYQYTIFVRTKNLTHGHKTNIKARQLYN